MATTTTPTSTEQRRMADVIDAMRTVQSESDRWTLAETLMTLIPKGTNGFDKIIDEAQHAGVAGKLSAHTLRLYRDTAARWPKSSRVPGVSFSAHREAMVMIGSDGNTKRAEKLLNDVRKTDPAVTVASVRRAAAVQQGKTPTGKAAGKSAPSGFDVLADLEGGASQLLAAINAADESRLDKLHLGLTKALTRVEQLRSKAQRAAAKVKSTPPTTTTPAKAPAAKKASANGSKRGDLRGL